MPARLHHNVTYSDITSAEVSSMLQRKKYSSRWRACLDGAAVVACDRNIQWTHDENAALVVKSDIDKQLIISHVAAGKRATGCFIACSPRY